jgi:hypothetical protein
VKREGERWNRQKERERGKEFFKKDSGSFLVLGVDLFGCRRERKIQTATKETWLSIGKSRKRKTNDNHSLSAIAKKGNENKSSFSLAQLVQPYRRLINKLRVWHS